MNKKVFFVSSICFVDQLPMLEIDRKRHIEWITQWKPDLLFQAIIAGSSEEALSEFRKEFGMRCTLHKYEAGAFALNLAHLPLTTINGFTRFDANFAGQAKYTGQFSATSKAGSQ